MMLVGSTATDLAVAHLDRWLDSMRGAGGYAGPVVHWWRDCLAFCGPGLDWRYEGIIAGYLAMFSRTGQVRWLEKARRAGDDLVGGQRTDGHFRDSQFELNPGVGGTPHEAAADIGLLMLAQTLRASGDESWQTYLRTAETNLQRFYLDTLWSESERRFRDDPRRPSFVPNKSATLIEALCLLADLTGRDEYLDRYVRPTVEAILAHQARRPGSRLDGAIAQNSLGHELIGKYFPYYNARCVPGLIAAYQHLGDSRSLDAALRGMSFVLRWRDSDGSFPQVVYESERVNRYPRWVAGLGDVLRATEILRPHGLDFPVEPTLSWIMDRQLPSGRFAVAQGFASQVSQKGLGPLPDARDLMPVVGWNDKIFRYLANQALAPAGESGEHGHLDASCRWQGQRAVFHEDRDEVCISLADHPSPPAYRWRKGASWAVVRSR